MSKYKTKFELDTFGDSAQADIEIIGEAPNHAPYVKINPCFPNSWGYAIKDKDLERFAVNILRALKSKRLRK